VHAAVYTESYTHYSNFLYYHVNLPPSHTSVANAIFECSTKQLCSCYLIAKLFIYCEYLPEIARVRSKVNES